MKLKGVNRRQMILRAVEAEKLIEPEHPARAIWELGGRLDLSGFRGTIESVEGEAGRPACDPRLLISLWIYAYSEGVPIMPPVTQRRPDQHPRSSGWGDKRQDKPEQCTVFACGFQVDFSALVVEDFLHDRQAKTRATFFATSHKRLENGVADAFRDTRAIVPDADFDMILSPQRPHVDPAGVECDRFAGVKNDVYDHLLQPSRIEVTLG